MHTTMTPLVHLQHPQRGRVARATGWPGPLAFRVLQPLDMLKMSPINAAQMSRQVVMRWRIGALGGLIAAVMLAGAAEAAELVMVRGAGCPWCARWDREIGPIYPKTEIGRRAPLRMVEFDRGGVRGLRTRGPIRYTPTFLLVDNAEEVGRIEGYPGEAFFWGLLERLMEQLQPQRSSAAAAPIAAAHAVDPAKMERIR